jgi:hypothetical protein
MSRLAIYGTSFAKNECIFLTKYAPILTSSFLPQDKVSEFAAMSPQQLLRETQRAAGDENLTIWHDTLISAGKQLKQMMQVRHYSV